MKGRTRLFYVILTALCAALAAFPASASSAGSASGGEASVTQDTYGWIRDARGWRYRFDDGRFPAAEWLYWENNWYLFDTDSYMSMGWRQVGDNYYYFDPVNGAMWHDRYTPDGYYVGPDGAMQLYTYWQ